MRIGETPNLTLYLHRWAKHVEHYHPPLLPPCPTDCGPAAVWTPCDSRPAPECDAEPAARSYEPACDPPERVVTSLPAEMPDAAPAARESTDPAYAYPGPAIGSLLDTVA